MGISTRLNIKPVEHVAGLTVKLRTAVNAPREDTRKKSTPVPVPVVVLNAEMVRFLVAVPASNTVPTAGVLAAGSVDTPVSIKTIHPPAHAVEEAVQDVLLVVGQIVT